MSEENVEVVRRIYSSLTCGDGAWRGLVASEVVVDFSVDGSIPSSRTVAMTQGARLH